MPFLYSGASLHRHVTVRTRESNLETIATLWETGELISYNKWLQRLQQEKKWKSKRGQKALEEQIIQQIEVLVEELGGTMRHLTKCNYTGRQSKIIEIEYSVVDK